MSWPAASPSRCSSTSWWRSWRRRSSDDGAGAAPGRGVPGRPARPGLAARPVHRARLRRPALDRLLGPLERGIYRVCGIRPREQMTWKRYALAMLAFNALGLLAVYALQRLQGWLPLGPQGLGPVDPDSAFNTAASFATNTNWQGYAGETTMSYATQMLGLAVQNFASAATGIAVLIALIRGLRARGVEAIGNFW